MLKNLNKRAFVSPASSSLVAIVTTIGDVTDLLTSVDERQMISHVQLKLNVIITVEQNKVRTKKVNK